MTLAKFVLLAIPGYFMQSTVISIGVCEKIKQIVRQFLWGSIGGIRKVALVKRDKCCMLLQDGGLGLRKLVP